MHMMSPPLKAQNRSAAKPTAHESPSPYPMAIFSEASLILANPGLSEVSLNQFWLGFSHLTCFTTVSF